MATTNAPSFFDLQNLRDKIGEGKLYNGELTFKFKLHSAPADELAAHDDGTREMDVSERIIHNYRYMIDNELTEWNLTDGGEPIPLESEIVLAKVPLSVLGEISAEISTLRSPGNRNGRR